MREGMPVAEPQLHHSLGTWIRPLCTHALSRIAPGTGGTRHGDHAHFSSSLLVLHPCRSVACRFVATVLFKSLQLANAGVGGIFHTGLFEPTQQELLVTKPLEVLSGSVPSDLDGYYMRTGPNPQFEPLGG